ncbi:MAG: hypothetical protein GX640_06800 [Fibrobacter sp.]|nr:hypothetical protein [Fibrobacter sp.]
MISIIICSRHTGISPSLKKNIEQTIGTEHEIITIDNSTNRYSIYSAYNEGVSLSRCPFLCFVHEDIKFHTTDWGIKLVAHLSDQKTGIIGVAGGKIMTKVPAQWSNCGRYINLIQYQHKTKISIKIKDPPSFSGVRHPAVLLDGVFLSSRRDVFNTIKFDETFSGFHGYDYDICAQAINAGFENYVIYDILLEHFSEGNMDERYYTNLIRIYKKWKNFLPVFSKDFAIHNQSELIEIDEKRMGRLFRRMSRRNFSSKEIVETIKYFIDSFPPGEAKKKIRFLYLKIFFFRLFQSPKYIFKYNKSYSAC